MTGKFVREERYIVFKVSDLGSCLTAQEIDELAYLARVVNANRERRGQSPLEGVFVEKDWPEYEPTWKAIEARVTGAQPAPSVPEGWPVYADPFTYVIQHLNSNPYSLTKDETITLIKELRDLHNAAPEAKP